MGRTHGPRHWSVPPSCSDDGTADGAISADGQILATYLHGLFEDAGACAALLRWAGLTQPLEIDHAARREQMLDRLADTIERECNLEGLLSAS